MTSWRTRIRRLRTAAEEWPYWWIPAAFLSLVAVVLGFIGFMGAEKPNREGYNAVEAAYHTLRLFVLGWPDPRSVPFILDVARFLAAAGTVAVAVRAALLLYAGRIEQLRAHRARGHTIVCGLGRRGVSTVDSLRARGHTVVAIESDPTARGVASARSQGALVVVGDATAPSVLRRAGILRARRLIVTSGGDETSVEVATAAANALPQMPGGLSGVVQLQDPDLATALNERVMAQAGGDGGPLRFTSLLLDGAKALLRRYPPPADGVSMIVGLTPFGEALLVAAARYHRLADGERTPLRVAVVDPRAERLIERLLILHPWLSRDLDLEAVEGEIDSPELERWLTERAATSARPIGQVYVCLSDEVRGLAGALHLSRRLAGCPVAVQTVSSSESAGRFLRPAAGSAGTSRLDVFGLIEETCSMELLLEPRNEVIARALHEEYLRHRAASPPRPGADAANRPWAELDDEWREANRAHARDIAAALGRLGIELLPIDSSGEGLVTLTDDEIETLARMEHDRWTADRLDRGWSLGSRDDRLRTHPDLVPWEELSDESKAIDRALMRARPELMARAGFALRRTSPDALPEG